MQVEHQEALKSSFSTCSDRIDDFKEAMQRSRAHIHWTQQHRQQLVGIYLAQVTRNQFFLSKISLLKI